MARVHNTQHIRVEVELVCQRTCGVRWFFFQCAKNRLDWITSYPNAMHENSGCVPRGKRAAIVRRYPFVWVFFPLCAVFSCFRNPSNSDMDYRIINARTFLCVRIHTGLGHADESAQLFFDSEKLTIFVCARDGIRTSGHRTQWISRPTLYQLSHHVLNVPRQA